MSHKDDFYLNDDHSTRDLIRLLGRLIMADIAEVNSKLDALLTAAQAISAEVATLKNQPPPVATQADIDALSAKVDAVSAAIVP